MTIPRAVGLTSGRLLPTILLLLLLHACAPSDAPPPASTQRDSAGIAIVESVRPAWGDSAHWRLDPEPLLDLATAGTGDPHDFYAVRGMKRLSDGSLVVLNAGSDEVRQFSADGRFVAFLSAASNLVPGDTNDVGTSSCMTAARPRNASW